MAETLGSVHNSQAAVPQLPRHNHLVYVRNFHNLRLDLNNF